MTEYGDFEDHQIKHLEMIQSVVARLGSNAFLIKGWAITVTGAFVAFAVDRNQWELAAASAVPTLLFWILDTSFLRNERLFRHLFARVAKGQEEPFFMSATSQPYIQQVKEEAEKDKSKEDVSSRFKTFWRETLLLFYGAVIVVALTVAVTICLS
ncbi:MAG: hypothetical protein AABM66_12455 [Actinomycetota bacterium]